MIFWKAYYFVDAAQVKTFMADENLIQWRVIFVNDAKIVSLWAPDEATARQKVKTMFPSNKDIESIVARSRSKERSNVEYVPPEQSNEEA